MGAFRCRHTTTKAMMVTDARIVQNKKCEKASDIYDLSNLFIGKVERFKIHQWLEVRTGF